VVALLLSQFQDFSGGVREKEGAVPIDRSSSEDNIQNPSIDKIMAAISLIDPPPDLVN